MRRSTFILYLLALPLVAIPALSRESQGTMFRGKTVCHQVMETADDGRTKVFSYHYDQSGSGDNADDPFWHSSRVGDSLVLKEAHVFDESEGWLAGDAANWHMIVASLSLPKSCNFQNLDESYRCLHRLLLKRNKIHPDIFWTFWHTFLPGPFDTGDLCEWAKVESLQRTQRIHYSNFIIWDWNDRRSQRGPRSRESREPKQSVDGVFIEIWESDDGWGADPIARFVILKGHRGTIEFQNRYASLKFENHISEESYGIDLSRIFGKTEEVLSLKGWIDGREGGIRLIHDAN